jgi:hypothetical protein
MDQVVVVEQVLQEVMVLLLLEVMVVLVQRIQFQGVQ